MESRIFTPEEANKTLPLMRSIVGDISRVWEQIILERTSLEQAEKEDSPNKGLAEKLKDSLRSHIDKINQYIHEVEEIGGFVEEFKRGIINFPAYSTSKGRKVFLCWQQDEEKVEYYHELDEGFSDRRRIRAYSQFVPYVP